ncbi:MAG: lysostaphin resistance A-like protein [Brevinematia bacterium]
MNNTSLRKKLVVFILVSFSFSWALSFVFYFTKEFFREFSTLILVLYMFGPTIGVVVTKKVFKEKILDLIKLKFNIWWVYGILSILVIEILTVLVSYVLGAGINTSWDQLKDTLVRFYENDQLQKIALDQLDLIGKSLNYSVFIYYVIVILSGVIAGISINAVAAFGEEFGWRGFLFEELKKFGFITSSFIIGFVWGLWHLPIIAMGHNFPQHPFEGIFLMILFCVVLSFVMNYFRQKSGSVILSSMMHGTLNGIGGLYIYANSVKNDILYNLTGVSGIIAVIVFIIILILFDREVFLSKEY